jgi:1,4-dihydroxy-2-naphthoate octaprenyltransferase
VRRSHSLCRDGKLEQLRAGKLCFAQRKEKEGCVHRIPVWWRAFRYHFVPPSFLPAALGAVAAWAITGKFSLECYVVVMIAVTLNHIALNMTDDYYDFKHSVDQTSVRGKNPYSGGSGLLTSGAIKPAHMRLAFFSLYLLTCAAGIWLTVTRGWQVLAFGLLGVLSAYFYTAPPIRYAYRGFGELSQLINFSLVIGLGSYFVQAQVFSWEAAFAVLPLGFMMFSMITINEIPDAGEDGASGKRTLVVRFGRLVGIRLYGAGLACAYLIILVSPLVGRATYWVYLGLLSLPWSARALAVLLKNYTNPVAMAPANMLTIRAHNLTGILLIAAYVIRGAVGQRPIRQMAIPLALLLLLYLPVAVTIFLPPRSLHRRAVAD